MGKQDSFYDHLRTRVDVLAFRPFYEDRVLVRRLPESLTDGSLHLPETRNKIGKGDYDLFGVQTGEVVAVGYGATGIWKDGEIRGTGEHAQQQPGYPKPWRIEDGPARAALDVAVGDRVLYERVHTNEFVQDGETYTFLFEEQHILGVIQ